MKKLILLLSLASFFSKAQNSYIPIPTDSAWWQVDVGGTWASGGTCYCGFTFQYQTNGDSVIGPYTYTKIVHNGPHVCLCGGCPVMSGLIRQDTAAKKVFVILKDSTNESLLYDFSQGKNDTVQSILIKMSWLTQPVIIDSVDYVVYGNQSRKRLRLNTSGWSSLYFIEGIGSTEGLLQYPFSFEAGAQLTCMGYKTKTIYPDSSFNCPVMGISETPDVQKKITLAPNPASGLITLMYPGEIRGAAVTNSLGETVYQISNQIHYDQMKLDMSSYSDGVYFIRIITDEGTGTRKVIISR